MAGMRLVAGHLAAACIFAAAGWGVATSEAADARFRRGDVDASGGIKITDPIVLLGHLFQGGAAPGCLDAADADDNGRVQITDAIYLLGYLFTGGPAPGAPFGDCGADARTDGLGCEEFEPCEGEPPVDAGIIYFRKGNELWTMAPDGSDKTPAGFSLPATGGELSRHLHGGSRWFLRTLAVNPGADTYPDGRQRFELFAENEAGEQVQLSDDSSIQPIDRSLELGATETRSLSGAAPRWTLDDRLVSYCGRRWNFSQGVVEELGIYRIALPGEFPANFKAVEPERLPVDLPEATHETYGRYLQITGMDWAPDGKWIVFGTCGLGLRVADVSSGNQTDILSHCQEPDKFICGCSMYSQPRWSPHGSAIAFRGLLTDESDKVTEYSIDTVAPDGTDRRTLAHGDYDIPSRGQPENWFWSPAGTRVVFDRWQQEPDWSRYFLICVTGPGEPEVILTNDIDDAIVLPVAWVASN